MNLSESSVVLNSRFIIICVETSRLMFKKANPKLFRVILSNYRLLGNTKKTVKET